MIWTSRPRARKVVAASLGELKNTPQSVKEAVILGYPAFYKGEATQHIRIPLKKIKEFSIFIDPFVDVAIFTFTEFFDLLEFLGIGIVNGGIFFFGAFEFVRILSYKRHHDRKN